MKHNPHIFWVLMSRDCLECCTE